MRKVLIACLLTTSCAGGEKRPDEKPAPSKPAEPAPPDVAEPPGTWHQVKAGETLWSIAEKYSSSVDEIMEVNGLADADELAVGVSLFIPEPDPMAPAPPPGGQLPPPDPDEDKPPVVVNAPLMWPLKEGVLFSEFGERHGAVHDGIDLGAPEGTAILAAADGDVIFAGTEQGAFGTLLVIQHADDRITVYAHNQVNLVKEGQKVKQGTVVAKVGRTGTAQSPHVHFEVRHRRKPVNPLTLLPPE